MEGKADPLPTGGNDEEWEDVAANDTQAGAKKIQLKNYLSLSQALAVPLHMGQETIVLCLSLHCVTMI